MRPTWEQRPPASSTDHWPLWAICLMNSVASSQWGGRGAARHTCPQAARRGGLAVPLSWPWARQPAFWLERAQGSSAATERKRKVAPATDHGGSASVPCQARAERSADTASLKTGATARGQSRCSPILQIRRLMRAASLWLRNPWRSGEEDGRKGAAAETPCRKCQVLEAPLLFSFVSWPRSCILGAGSLQPETTAISPLPLLSPSSFLLPAPPSLPLLGHPATLSFLLYPQIPLCGGL